MPTGISGDTTSTAIRMHRLESAHTLADIHHELRVTIEELSELIADDLTKVRQRHEEFEATIALDFDQYGLTRLVYERAMDLRSFFALYRAKVRYAEYIGSFDDEVAVHCVHLAYKLMLCTLENEPNIDDTIFYAWRGHLELS